MINVIELAEKAGLAFGSDEYPEIWQLYMHVGRDEITRFAKLVRNAALEEAAQKAFSWNTAMTDTLAKEMRELKEPTP